MISCEEHSTRGFVGDSVGKDHSTCRIVEFGRLSLPDHKIHTLANVHMSCRYYAVLNAYTNNLMKNLIFMNTSFLQTYQSSTESFVYAKHLVLQQSSFKLRQANVNNSG